MSRTQPSAPRRGVAVALAAAAVLAVVVLFAAPSHAATGRGCSGTASAGHGRGVLLRAGGLRATDVSCRRAHTIVTAYLHKKLSDQTERCAGEAQNPPYKGCRVDGYRCRATERARPRRAQPEICTDGRRKIRFSEHDRSGS